MSIAAPRKSSVFSRIGLAAALLASGSTIVPKPDYSAAFAPSRGRKKKKQPPAGSKLARMAWEQRVAVRHGGMRVDHVDAIRFRQVHK